MPDAQNEHIERFDKKTAILVDGGFYKIRAHYLWGEKTPQERAEELKNFCMWLLRQSKYEKRELYRIFYYDCPPSGKNVYHPFLKKSVNLKTTELYRWQIDFLDALKSMRKFALRLGELSDDALHYTLDSKATKKLLRGDIQITDLTERDFRLDIIQKGVDMKIGVDMTSLALKKQVDQIILISGDSDFVPASKQARREGIDMILATMGADIKANLHEHIDGLIRSTPKADRLEDT